MKIQPSRPARSGVAFGLRSHIAAVAMRTLRAIPPARTLSFATLALVAAPVAAQPVRPFSLAALAAARAAGTPVLVDAFAPWCPTCRAQAPTIDRLATDPAYKTLLILRLDYDSQTAEKKALGIAKQSTLIVFRSGKEAGRTLGITDPGQIRAFAASALR